MPRIINDVPYGSHPRQAADIYRPRSSNRPVVVFVHGGSWRAGSKQTYRFVGRALATMGFVGVVINYRLSPEISFPAFVEDAAAALRWAHTEAAGWGGDPERIFVMGHSAGGHIAALSILDREYLNDPGWLKGCIGLAGVYDFYPAPSLRPAFGRALAAGRRWSPIDMARRVGTPFLLLHGRRDLTVGAGNSRNLARRLKELGTPVQLELFNLGHMTLVATFLPGWRRVSSVPQTVKRFVESVQ